MHINANKIFFIQNKEKITSRVFPMRNVDINDKNNIAGEFHKSFDFDEVCLETIS